MNKYLIYTTQGHCSAPDHQDVDNCQLLGRIEAADKSEALNKFLEDNPWAIEFGFTEFSIAQPHDSEWV